MSRMIVAISGPPGSGKTTIARMFSEKYGFELVSAGTVFRTQARDSKMTLEEYGELAEKNHEIDRKLDELIVGKVKELLEDGKNVVVDGRLSAHMLTRARIDCLKVWIDATLKVRAERISRRENLDEKVALERAKWREEAERSRYEEIYGINLLDKQPYDLVIDSSDKTPEEVLSAISRELKG